MKGLESWRFERLPSVNHRFWMLLGNLAGFSLRLDVNFDRGIVRRFLYALRTKHSTFRSAITVSYNSVSEQDVVWAACCLGINFATNERIIDYFWMLVGSLQRFSLHLLVLWKRTAISLRCKNEAFNISERYCSQSLFLFLNNVLAGY